TVTTQTDVSVVKAGPPTATAGTSITYTITVSNAGPSDAQNVTLTDFIPTNTTATSFMQQSGPAFTTSFNGAAFTATATTLGAGQSAVFLFVVTVSPGAANGSTINNTSTVSSTTPDSDTTNNASTVITTVNTQADLAVTKADTPDPVIAGNDITYTITVSN